MRSPWALFAALLLAPAAVLADPPRVSFVDAVRRAAETHPTVTAARIAVTRATALTVQSRALLLPTVTLNLTYTRLDDDRRLNDRIILGGDQLSGNVQVLVPLYNARAWASLHRAEDAVDLARASHDDARRAVSVAAARAWLTVSSQHRIVATSERALANAEAHRDFAQERLQGGVGNRLDAVRAAQDVAAIRMTLASQRAALARAQESLGVLAGDDTGLDAVDDIDPAAPPPVSVAEAEVRRRADVRALEVRVRNAERAADESWADYLPSLGAVFQPFYQNPPSLTQPLVGWQAQAVLSWVIFDGGARYGAAADRRAQREDARAQLAGALRQARAEVRAAAEAVRFADERAAAAREAAALAAEAAELADAAWRAGATGTMELIDARRRERDARATANMAVDDARQSRLDVLIAAGRFPEGR